MLCTYRIFIGEKASLVVLPHPIFTVAIHKSLLFTAPGVSRAENLDQEKDPGVSP